MQIFLMWTSQVACMHFYPARRKYICFAHDTCECSHRELNTMSKNNLRLITLRVSPMWGVLYLLLDREEDRVCGGGGGEAGLVS